MDIISCRIKSMLRPISIFNNIKIKCKFHFLLFYQTIIKFAGYVKFKVKPSMYILFTTTVIYHMFLLFDRTMLQ